MKKKRIVSGIVILLLVCLGVYFWPMNFADLISENSTISISVSELGVREGLPYIDTDSCLDMKEEQKRELTALLGDYSYRRNIGTFFSDGSMTGIGDHLIYLFVYEDEVRVNSIVISSTGQCAVNGKTYHVRNGGQLVDQIGAVIGK